MVMGLKNGGKKPDSALKIIKCPTDSDSECVILPDLCPPTGLPFGTEERLRSKRKQGGKAVTEDRGTHTVLSSPEQRQISNPL